MVIFKNIAPTIVILSIVFMMPILLYGRDSQIVKARLYQIPEQEIHSVMAGEMIPIQIEIWPSSALADIQLKKSDFAMKNFGDSFFIWSVQTLTPSENNSDVWVLKGEAVPTSSFVAGTTYQWEFLGKKWEIIIDKIRLDERDLSLRDKLHFSYLPLPLPPNHNVKSILIWFVFGVLIPILCLLIWFLCQVNKKIRKNSLVQKSESRALSMIKSATRREEIEAIYEKRDELKTVFLGHPALPILSTLLETIKNIQYKRSWVESDFQMINELIHKIGKSRE